MKKFLIFLVVIVVGVSLGLTTYYFMRDDETISINTKEIYCNVGDVISTEDLNIVITRPYSYRNTTFDYNAGGPAVQSMINYDETNGYYTALAGGETTLVITTTNKRCPEFRISVHIGNGTEEYPYYIDNQADLQKMGDVYALDANYSLINSFTLTQSFQPIGYNYSTDTWVGFSGSFNGNGHTISGLNLSGTDYTNAGLFYSLNNANVTNLNINSANINGSYDYAGALTGNATNSVISNIFVTNSNITNLKDNSVTGGVLGAITGATSKLSVSSTENVNITLGSAVETGETEGETETTPATPISVTAGGLVGIVDQSTVQATKANSTVTVQNATGDISGFVGRFVIGTDTGSIFESLSLSTIVGSDNASFVSTVQKSTNYNDNNSQPLVHFAGNVVVTNGIVAIRNYDETMYETFFNEQNSLYLVRELNSADDMVATLAPTDYVFYAVSQTSKVMWDNSAWTLAPGAVPVLNMTNSSLSTLSSQYLLKDLTEDSVGDVDGTTDDNATAFIEYLQNNADNGVITDKKIVLEADIDLTNRAYTPFALVNSVFDGNSHTITGLTITDNNGYAGLFTYLDNSTVTNLTLEGVTMSANATNAGAIAGRLYSSTANSSSEISNVTVNYPATTDDVNGQITNFGGIVGVVENNSAVRNVAVNNLNVASTSQFENAGGIAGVVTSGRVENSEVSNTVIYGTTNVGGVVGNNSGTINNITNNLDNGTVSVRYSANTIGANIGGVAGLNNGFITNVTMAPHISIVNSNETIYVGGIAGRNNSEISNVTLTSGIIEVASTVSANRIYIGGATAENNALISEVKIYLSSIGEIFSGKDYYVGGIAALNSTDNSVIERSIVTSNIYGNTVAGIVAQMGGFDTANNNVTAANCGAVIDQVYVGGYNESTNELSRNRIRGDKLVAGAVCILTGDVTNVQLNSVVEGTANSTVTSLITLIFPDGASFKYATVNSVLDGYGTFYKDTWYNYVQVSGNFHFNLYQQDSVAGSMQHVVVNTEAASSLGNQYGESYIRTTWLFGWRADYDNTENSSFVKNVNSSDFANAASFKGSFNLTDTNNRVSYTKTLNYNFDGIWVEGNGIRLSILN